MLGQILGAGGDAGRGALAGIVASAARRFLICARLGEDGGGKYVPRLSNGVVRDHHQITA
jgi:hypothetical protein